ncbi:MAG: hypothetical protein ACOC3W_02495 [Thermodesulfobacteriota bacterium]
MKKCVWMIFLAAMVLFPASGFAQAGLVVGVTPGIFLYSPDADGHEVSDGLKTEEIDGYLSNLATLNAGIAWDAKMFYLDLTGGVGYLYNSTFTSFVYMGDLALRFKLPTEVMTLGPHVSLLEFQPDWDGDADVSLADTTGYVAGLAFTVGTKPFSFAASIDYVDASFEVESDRLPVTNADLDLSGLAVQVGVLFRF